MKREYVIYIGIIVSQCIKRTHCTKNRMSLHLEQMVKKNQELLKSIEQNTKTLQNLHEFQQMQMKQTASIISILTTLSKQLEQLRSKDERHSKEKKETFEIE